MYIFYTKPTEILSCNDCFKAVNGNANLGNCIVSNSIDIASSLRFSAYGRDATKCSTLARPPACPPARACVPARPPPDA